MDNAPVISSETLPTPAHEWANETLNSVPSNAGNHPSAAPSSSAATTPGFDLPGAYPRTPSTQVPLGNTIDVNAITDRAKEAAVIASATVVDVVHSLPEVGNIGGGLEGVKEALYNASVTASQYLPPQIVEYFPGGSEIVDASNAEGRLKDAQGVSLPSTETSVNHTPSKGVGSLPGPISEEGVAKLPLEREISLQNTLKVQQQNTGASESLTNVSTVAQYGSSVATPTMEKSVDTLTAPGFTEADLDNKVPDTVTSSTAIDADIPVPNIPPITTIPVIHTVSSPSSVPVASPSTGTTLPHSPQSKNESTIANVGHEKLSSEFPSTPSLTSKADTATTTASPDSPVSPVDSFARYKDQNELATPKTHTYTHTKDTSVSSAFSNSTFDQDEAAVHQHDKSVSSGSTTSTPSRKKTNLLTKIKGEAKIISGKLGGKEEKVEEGRRLIRGEVD
ncbi:hypothetical protein F5878DRAFT_327567 [Lentinula raphanica]|uniref:Uncharacterized protein n=1 Tax=Lentinula raphanica TaxID=153919 RepID=A0AA38P2I8_9AGAR|nr:hypothetical protein F5878DRAFT_327567 [Lentinula raphanica]